MKHFATFNDDHTKEYRYLLGRTWDESLPQAVFIMLNPSTADAEKDDPTIRRCISFAQDWGAGSLSVRNLYTLCTAHPRVLKSHASPLGEAERYLLHEIASAKWVVVAWGAHRMARLRAKEVMELLRQAGVSPQCLGITKAGHPRHPLYVSAVTELRPYYLP
ncbi:DUF1643 domain-containing protein [Hymenobacter sp. UV11]|uniref:DUF1643 domain-containing protein n=1 Tax=Hymenobacter sp. UV11 TaxID=1849735 RepID=UPI00105BA6FA|nr:DUF1643 domain-containing protein [Hymenobacter sp. UV11]